MNISSKKVQFSNYFQKHGKRYNFYGLFGSKLSIIEYFPLQSRLHLMEIDFISILGLICFHEWT